MSEREPGSDLASILWQAEQLPAGPRRTKYLDQACAGNSSRRREVDQLLAALDGAQRSSPPLLEQLGDRVEISSEPKGSSAEKLTAAFATSTEEGEDPLVGTFVGAFKIRERLGEGGLAWCTAAEQSEPVRRKVALKIIKPGMDTKEVIARFEAERQAWP